MRFIQCGAIGVNVTATCFLCPQQTGRSLLVPVIYSIFVLDLKLIKWDKHEEKAIEGSVDAQPAEAVG